MNWNTQSLRKGALVLLVVVLVRILLTCTLGKHVALFAQPQPAAFLLADAVQEPDQEAEQPPEVTTEPPTEPTTEPPTEPVTEPTEPTETYRMPEVPEEGFKLEAADASCVEINYVAKKKFSVSEMLQDPLRWELAGEKPTVLIIHTHGTEAYTPVNGETYKEEGGVFRTTDKDHNMIAVGQELTRLLNAAGIKTVHDQTFYDYPDYEAAYDNARVGLKEQLEQNSGIKLVIDLHRDAAQWEDGSQWATEATIKGEKSAQVMLVVGTDTYYTNPNWEQNLSMALKLHAVMEKTHPGSTRPLDLRNQRFNQDLQVGTVIAEIGAAGNTQREAMNAVSVLAEAIILLANGTQS